MDNNGAKLVPMEQGLHINHYEMQENLYAFDRGTDLASRLRYLAIGLRLYEANDLSPDLFVVFHTARHQRINRAVFCLNLLLFVASCLLCFKSSFWDGRDEQRWEGVYLVCAATCWFVYFVIWGYMRRLRRNFVNTMRVLTTSQYIIQLKETPINDLEAFKRLETSINKGEFHKFNTSMVQKATTVGEFGVEIGHGESRWSKTSETQGEAVRTDEVLVSNQGTYFDQNRGFKTVANDSNANGAYSDSQFKKELAEISVQRNQINDMPMRDVIEYFMVMCCSSCGREIPQMTKHDFITFLRVGFLGCPAEKKITLDRFEPGVTIDVFHRFMTRSVDKLYGTKKGMSRKYLGLLIENFNGFDFDTHGKNFRSLKKSELPRISEQYKSEIQLLLPLQK